ncbi:MAG TPA: YhbY family RNA-binding protein [Myxococcota bacterium]|nr:YhbY family RNA-binding protein [Myxococcota bacterium]
MSENATPETPPAAGPVLAGFQRKYLRALAHPLRPVVQVGDAGVTTEVVQAVRTALRDHELIKVRMRQPKDKAAFCQAMADGSGSAVCGLVGHTAILYKPHPKKPQIHLPQREG